MKKLNTEIIIEKLKFIYNNKYDYSLIDYKNYNTKIKLICDIHGIFEQTPKKLLCLKKGCPKCNLKVKDVTYYINKFNKTHNNKYDYRLFKSFKTNKDIIKIICKEHGIFEMSIINHFKYGCKICSEKYLNNNMFIEKANNIHNNKYIYLSEYKGNKSKIKILCNIHGEFVQCANSHLKGSGCPVCNLSKGENIILNYLKKNNIEFEYQKKFNKCINNKHLIFDFYLPEYNICIEFDGIQHFESNEFFGGLKEFNKRLVRDKIKNEFCYENNIKLIRIKYDENIIKSLDDFIFS